MNVVLLKGVKNEYPDLPFIAAKRCRGVPPEASKMATHQSKLALLEKLFLVKHLSIFEHCSCMFDIQGASRACLDQLNRHRHTTVHMESQRAVDIRNSGYAVPDSIAKNEKALDLYKGAMKARSDLYAYFVDVLKIPKEDARYLMEMGRLSSEVMSFNLSEMFHISAFRLCSQAQDEVRRLVSLLQSALVADCPDVASVLKLSKPDCASCPTKCKTGPAGL